MGMGAWWEPDLSERDSRGLAEVLLGVRGPKVSLPDPRDQKLRKSRKMRWDKRINLKESFDIGVKVRGEVIVALEELASEAGVPVDSYLEWLILRAAGGDAVKAFQDRIEVALEAELQAKRNSEAHWGSD